MKEFTKYFTRSYSIVNGDDQNQKCSQQLNETKRRKSLNPNRSINPGFNIINSFFNERHNSQGARWPKCAFLLLAGGLLAITIAVLVKILQPYELFFKWKLILERDGEIFNLWEKPPVDLYIKIYLFNITNSEAFLAGREKMNVQEVGPYVYKELMTHENVTFNDNGTLSSIPRHPLVWQEHLSEGRREDDEVVMLNIAMLSISHLAASRSFFFRLPINMVISQTNSQPIVRMTAKEFMFGYQTQLTTLGNTLMPGWIYFDKVGLIDRMYDFDTDYETFYTGVSDPSISGVYATYRGSSDLPQWKGEHCSNIDKASDGTKFQSFIKPNDTVKFFRKSMCRPQALKRVGDEVTVNGLNGFKYVFEDNAFDNGEYNEKNKCFCREGYCQPRGLIDVTDCYYGFPISLSYPHFMDSDPGLVNNVTGLMPDKEKHSSEFIVQPESGMPLSLSVKIQINMHLRDVRLMTKVKRFTDTTFPMLWFEIVMFELPPSINSRFNFYLNYLPYVDVLCFWGGLTIGIICLTFAITRATIRMSKYTQAGSVGGAADCTANGQYSKVNLFRSGGVYNPCETKLMETNEKMRPMLVIRTQSQNQLQNQQQQQQEQQRLQSEKHHFISRSDDDDDDDDDNVDNENDGDRKFTTNSVKSAFLLEDEPAISMDSSGSSDEGNESDFALMGADSSLSSLASRNDEYSPTKRCSIDRRNSKGKITLTNSISSGFNSFNETSNLSTTNADHQS